MLGNQVACLSDHDIACLWDRQTLGTERTTQTSIVHRGRQAETTSTTVFRTHLLVCPRCAHRVGRPSLQYTPLEMCGARVAFQNPECVPLERRHASRCNPSTSLAAARNFNGGFDIRLTTRVASPRCQDPRSAVCFCPHSGSPHRESGGFVVIRQMSESLHAETQPPIYLASRMEEISSRLHNIVQSQSETTTRHHQIQCSGRKRHAVSHSATATYSRYNREHTCDKKRRSQRCCSWHLKASDSESNTR